MRIGIYARVSTQKQADKGVSIEDQIRRGVEFCNKNNYEYEIFKDEGFSGDLPIEERPALSNLFDKFFLKDKELNGLFVVEFDRLTRNPKESIIIRELLLDNNIQLYELAGPVNLNDPTQDLLMGIKGLLGSFERKKTIVRIKRALETSALSGKALGGPIVNYGFEKDDNGMLIVKSSEAEVVKKIYQLCLEGNGTKVISNYLNTNGIPTKRMNLGGMKMKVKNVERTEFIWRDSVVYNILTNPIYKGERHFKNHIIPCDAIIDKNVFDAVQITLKNRKNFKNTTNKYFYLLKGLIFCAKCNSRFYGRKRADLSDNQYICSSQRYSVDYCGNRGINITKLDKWIWDSVLSLPDDFKNSLKLRLGDDQIGNINKAIEEIQATKRDLENEAMNLIELFSKEKSSNRFVKNRLKEIEIETNKIDEIILKLERKTIKSEHEQDIISFLLNTIKPFKNLNILEDEKQTLIRALIEKININWNVEELKHQIQIIYRFDSYSEILLTKDITINYRKSGYSIRTRDINEIVKVEIRSPSSRQIHKSDSKDLFIKYDKLKNN
jgi:DNA invertase Pin-like site-specific DNA recombinase